MSKRLSRFAALLLVACLMLSLSSCSPYRVEMSTAQQAEIVMRTGEHEIAFEVLDFFYHNYKSVIDGGDASVWEGEEAAAYHARLMARATEAACELYAVFACAKGFGVDPWGADIQERVDEAIRAVIDSYDTRREYIEYITSLHMTDTVYRLLLRSYICQQYLLEYSDGVSAVSDEDLLAFCEDPAVVNTLCLTVYYAEGSEIAREWARGRMEEISAALADVTTDEGFRAVARQYATTVTSELEHGTYMTLREYRRLAGDATATPALGDMSAPLWDTDSVMVLRFVEKDYGYIRENPSAVRSCYLEYLVENAMAELQEGLTLTDAGAALTRESFA